MYELNCNKKFLINSLPAHKKICLGLSEIYRCKVCLYETNLKRNLNSHQKVHKSVHVCSYCMYSSKKVDNLNRHLLQKHNISVNDLKVSNSVGFGIFENRIETDENSTKQCDMCTYSSSKTYNLNRHLLTKHSNEDI